MAGLIVKIKGDVSHLKKSLGEAKSSTSSFFNEQGRLSLAAVGGYTAAAGVAATLGKAAIQIGLDFDTARSNIARATGETGKDLEKVYTAFKETFGNVPDDMNTVADVIGDAATRFAGASQKALEEVSQTALAFARVTGGNATIAIQSLGQAAHAMGLNVTQAKDAMDVWTGVAQQTGISGNELATTLAKNATLFETLGVDAAEAAIMIGQFHAAGLKSSVVGTVLSNVASYAAAAGITMEQALREVQRELINAKTDTEAVEIATGIFGETIGPKLALQIRETNIVLTELSASVEGYRVNTIEAANATISINEELDKNYNQIKSDLTPVWGFLIGSLAWYVNEGRKTVDMTKSIGTWIWTLGGLLGDTEDDLDDLTDAGTGFVADWGTALHEWNKTNVQRFGTDWTGALHAWTTNFAKAGAAVREEIQHVADSTTALAQHQQYLFSTSAKAKEYQHLILEDSTADLVGFTPLPPLLSGYTPPDRQEIAPHIQDLVLQTLAVDTSTGNTIVTGGTGGTGTTTTGDKELTPEELAAIEAAKAAAAAEAARRHQEAIERLLDANDNLSESYSDQIDALAKKIELDELAEELDLEDPTGMRAAGIKARKDLLDYLETSQSSLDDAAKDWADLTAEELESGLADLESYQTEFDIFRDQIKDLRDEERHAAGLQRLRDSVLEPEPPKTDPPPTDPPIVTTGSGTTTSGDLKIILEADGRSLQNWQVNREDLDGTHRVLRARAGQVVTRPVGACG